MSASLTRFTPHQFPFDPCYILCIPMFPYFRHSKLPPLTMKGTNKVQLIMSFTLLQVMKQITERICLFDKEILQSGNLTPSSNKEVTTVW